ncbi:MAG: sulfatase family protein [Actinomycetota bacterium]
MKLRWTDEWEKQVEVIRRRTVWASVCAVALAASLLASDAGSAAPEGKGAPKFPKRPNILIVLLDDVRADELLSVMPATRRLFKEEGTRFTNMFATTPLCCPSRTSILTGEYAHNHFVQDNKNSRPLRRRQKYTIEAYLKRAGYKTAVLGKILNSWPLRKDPRFFHRWTLSRGGYERARYNINGRSHAIGKYSTKFLAGQTEQLLSAFEKADKHPWFIHLSTYAAHAPYLPEKRYRDAEVPAWDMNPAVGEEDRSDKPPWVNDAEVGLGRAASIREGQLRTLMSVDDLVARVYRHIRALDEENTLAFFVSDNGFMWGEHGRLFKRTPYDPSIRLPLLMRWPGHVESGVVDKRIVANIDIAPTILEAAEIETRPERPMDGRSLLQPGERERLLLEYWAEGGHGFPTWYATRTKEYQYTRYEDSFGDVIFREYYDLVEDPWQLNNLFGDANPTNDPVIVPLDLQLDQDIRCRAATCP